MTVLRDNPGPFIRRIIYLIGGQTMLYLTCIMISSVECIVLKNLGIWGLWYKGLYCFARRLILNQNISGCYAKTPSSGAVNT